MEVFVKIIAIFNLVASIVLMVWMSRNLMDATERVKQEFRYSIQRPISWDRVRVFIRANSLYFWGQMFRFSILGIFAINLNQLDAELLGIKPNIAFIFGSLFYVSLIGVFRGWFIQNANDKRQIESLKNQIEQLKNKK